MLSDFLKKHITSQASYVDYGYGQVEPNHLSAQRTAQIYAQLPAAEDINVLEQGQFVKYDYAKGLVNFEGAGEWMLVYNETKLYRDHQMDCEFAMIKDNYQARIYSPYGYGVDKDGNPTADLDTAWDRQSRYYNGKDAEGNTSITIGEGDKAKTYDFDDVTAAPDMYELHYNEDPFHITGSYKAQMMPENGSSMVPRVFKTNIGDIFTTNMVKELTGDSNNYAVGDILVPVKNDDSKDPEPKPDPKPQPKPEPKPNPTPNPTPDPTPNPTPSTPEQKVVKVSKITVSGMSKKIAAGKKITLTTEVLPADASNKAVTWTSSNTKYATVNSKGVVTTKKKGIGKNVVITATAADGSGVKAAYKIKIVKDKVKSVKLKASNKSVKAGKKVIVKATVKTTGKTANKALEWTSSNTKYATVSSKGVVTTKKEGKGKTVKITAKATDGTGKKATIKIKIKK